MDRQIDGQRELRFPRPRYSTAARVVNSMSVAPTVAVIKMN